MFTESKITEIYCYIVWQMFLQGIFPATGKIYARRYKR